MIEHVNLDPFGRRRIAFVAFDRPISETDLAAFEEYAKRYNPEPEPHLARLQRIATATREFFEQAMPGVDIERIAALAADMMAAELTGATIAASSPSPKVERDTHG